MTNIGNFKLQTYGRSIWQVLLHCNTPDIVYDTAFSFDTARLYSRMMESKVEEVVYEVYVEK